MLNVLTRLWEVLTSKVDSFLFGVAMAIAGVGIVTLISATDQSVARITTQAMSLAFALVLMWIVANIPPQTIARAAVPLYLFAVVMLIAVAVFGTTVNGSKRWLNLGVARFQPSELMKIALPLMLAWYFQKLEGRIGWTDFVVTALLIAVPVWLIKRQPDLGTALLIAASGFYVLYLAGLSWKIIVGLTVLGAAAAPLIWPYLHDYQRERLLTFIDPARDPLGAGYHSSQASIALGSGGVVGKGWMNGTQTHLDFLPEKHTDFVSPCSARSSACRQRRAPPPLPAPDRPRDDDHRECVDDVRATHRRRGDADVLHLCVRQHGHGERRAAGSGVPLPLVSYGGTASSRCSSGSAC
jgi:rod shape determining protein RodA